MNNNYTIKRASGYCFPGKRRGCHVVTKSFNDGRTRNQIDRSRWAPSVIGCRAQTGNEHDSGHAMVYARLRLRMKAARISNRSAKLDMAKLKTTALENFRLELPHRFEGLKVLEDVQAHLGRACRRRQDGVIGETIALAEHARLSRFQCTPNHRDLMRQTTRALQRGRNAYWKAWEGGDLWWCMETIRYWNVSAADRPKWVKFYLNEMEASF